MQIRSVTIIGTGNLAWHLGKALSSAGVEIVHVAGRTEAKAKELADILKCKSHSAITKELPVSDLYLICVKDDAIREVAQAIYTKDKFMAHTSGTTSSDVLKADDNRFGVLWPMQTLVMGNEVNYQNMLISVTGSDDETARQLSKLAEKISGRVEVVTDAQRAVLHMTAVWVNNFTNHMFDIADSILKEHHLKFELMVPMIEEMMQKAGSAAPEQLQTGPAKRGDMMTMDKHMHLLGKHPVWKQLYYDISRSIIHKFIKQ